MFVVLAEKAFDEDGNLKQPKQLSINKVGHGMVLLITCCQQSCFIFQPTFLVSSSTRLFLDISDLCYCSSS